MLDYEKFDLFCEIKHQDKVVGFIALEKDDLNNRLIINEAYIIPNMRGSSLFFNKFCDIIKGSEEVFIRKPNRNLIKVLLRNNLAFKMSDDIVISYVDFIVQLKDTVNNFKIKSHYKKVKDGDLSYIANLFDLNISGVLFFDDKSIFSKNPATLCICEARKYDLKKFSIRKNLKKFSQNTLMKHLT